jgi:anti-sigma factor RsiW
MTCHEAEDNLAAYVDGLSSRAAEIDAHLATCAKCRDSVHAQRVGRTVLRQQASELLPLVPPGLRTRLIALGTQVPSPTSPNLAWTGRLTAFAAAAMVVLTLGAVLLPVVTIRSTAVLAAQLALDHLKCFTIDGDADGHAIASADAEATLLRDFDFSVTVPASLPSERLELLAVRRCLYGDGRAAHLLYRVNGEPVSLFILPGLTRPAAELSLFGHDEVVWTQGDRTYMLVARAGLASDLGRVASYLRTEAK